MLKLSSTLHMPKYNINFDNGQQNKSEEDILYDLCYSNLEKIIQNKKEPSKYINELNRELQVIKQFRLFVDIFSYSSRFIYNGLNNII